MRTTITIDDELIADARELTGEERVSELVRMGLKSLVEWEASRRLATLGGTMPDLQSTPRRRSDPEE